jgi:sn-glycerol 3-phosphate transport system substrate-binding protein
VQTFDVGALDLMLSEAYYHPAYKLIADNGYSVAWKNYFPGISSYYSSSNGDMFSFPFNSSTALLYWNKDAFAKINKTDAPSTWEDAEADMVALKATGDDCPMAIDVGANEVWQLLEQFSAIHDQPIASKNRSPPRIMAMAASTLNWSSTRLCQRSQTLVRPGSHQAQVADGRRRFM